MNETKVYYVIKLFSIENNKYSYLCANNPYYNVFEAKRFSSYEDAFNRMQEFFIWGFDMQNFDMAKSKICKITLIEEEI